jgi:glycosyltransferase involved in cell wall biosynthesis
MQISVVIPTCDRKRRLISLLGDLDRSVYPIREVIIVDSGDDRLDSADYAEFGNLQIRYMRSERSVCMQRNAGIRCASAEWIFLCDDDVEMPPDHLQKLAAHLQVHEGIGAACGLFLQKEGEEWTASYPVRSTGLLLWKYFFRLGFWGEIRPRANNLLVRKIQRHYHARGNHISRSGWPVLTDLSGDHFDTPVYTLGAALVKKEWLLQSPFDETLDRYGIGDNYGVCLGFPAPGIRVLTRAFVYHHKSPVNRLQRPIQYFRRVLTLDYFISKLGHASRGWLLWSLTGNFLAFLFAGDRIMLRPALRAIRIIALGRNPYTRAAQRHEVRTEPTLSKN